MSYQSNAACLRGFGALPTLRRVPMRSSDATTLRPARSGTAAAGPRRGPGVRRLGRIAYREAWERQRAWVDARRSGRIPDTLFLLGHPPVVTLGRAADRMNLLATADTFAQHRIEVVETDRGGDVTFHGPGQIVGYAIVDLRHRDRDLHRFLRDLEDVLIRALSEFGIDGRRVPGLTGVWVAGSKIAAIGVRVSRWITYHGFALNVETDLSYFDLIVPCGIENAGVTSMRALLGRDVRRSDVESALEASFVDVFTRSGVADDEA